MEVWLLASKVSVWIHIFYNQSEERMASFHGGAILWQFPTELMQSALHPVSACCPLWPAAHDQLQLSGKRSGRRPPHSQALEEEGILLKSCCRLLTHPVAFQSNRKGKEQKVAAAEAAKTVWRWKVYWGVDKVIVTEVVSVLQFLLGKEDLIH